MEDDEPAEEAAAEEKPSVLDSLSGAPADVLEKINDAIAASEFEPKASQAAAEDNVIFPGMTYAMSLAVLKLAAQGCGFPDAQFPRSRIPHLLINGFQS